MDDDDVKLKKAAKRFYVCGISLGIIAGATLLTAFYMLRTTVSLDNYLSIVILLLVGSVLSLVADACESHSWMLYDICIEEDYYKND